jgi:hypothetical protein
MNLLLHIKHVIFDHLFFSEKKVNMIMEGYFTTIIYSNPSFSMNGIFISCPFKPLSKGYPKNILFFDVASNKELIHRLCILEKQLLQYFCQTFMITNKTPVYNIRSQLQNGSMKYYKEPGAVSSRYYIKISGIWENPTEMGITFKLVEY